MESGGIEGYYCNHSLRKSTCTRLFEKGVDPQLIREQTGHKSNAVMLYKKSNLTVKKQVSDMLNVLPNEMQFLRERKQVMLQAQSGVKSTKKKTETALSEPIKIDEKK